MNVCKRVYLLLTRVSDKILNAYRCDKKDFTKFQTVNVKGRSASANQCLFICKTFFVVFYSGENLHTVNALIFTKILLPNSF